MGYRGVKLTDVHYYEKWGIIPNAAGRVLTDHVDGQLVYGNYVVGWIKRGPSGVIGTNKPDAVETVECLLEDMRNGDVLTPDVPDPDAIPALLKKRGVRFVSYEDWRTLDRLEIERGVAIGRPRLKFSSVTEMLAALEETRTTDPTAD